MVWTLCPPPPIPINGWYRLALPPNFFGGGGIGIGGREEGKLAKLRVVLWSNIITPNSLKIVKIALPRVLLKGVRGGGAWRGSPTPRDPEFCEGFILHIDRVTIQLTAMPRCWCW